MNISIISACNNNCEYCFQKDYHTQNKMLTIEELEEIFSWGKNESRIGLLGGEPTLHPDIVNIVKKAKEYSSVCVFTNLLCKTDLLNQLLEIPNMGYLVNTTSRDELRDLFYKNVELLYKRKEYLKEANIGFSFGLTLMNNVEIDLKNILNLFNILDTFPGVTTHVRMGLATPFHKGTFELMNYDSPVKYMIKKVSEEYPDLTIGFDCPSNNCQISENLVNWFSALPNVKNFEYKCNGPIFDVLVDKSLKYCFSFPDDFMRVDSYTRFKNSDEARKWYIDNITEYMKNNAFQCKKDSCTKKLCQGPCPAVNEYLRRQH